MAILQLVNGVVVAEVVYAFHIIVGETVGLQYQPGVQLTGVPLRVNVDPFSFQIGDGIYPGILINYRLYIG